MVDIEVIISSDKKVFVTPRTARVKKGEWIVWHIASQCSSIDSVEIHFKKHLAGVPTKSKKPKAIKDPEDAAFFDATPLNRHGVKLSHVRLLLNGVSVEDGEAVVTACAPRSTPGRHTYRYAVRGFDSSGKRIAYLDPEIITEDGPP